MDKFYHAVNRYEDRCMGCTTCMKHCPSGAIRLKKGKAYIIDEACTDCGECARVCPVHAIRTDRVKPESTEKYKYKVALPDPSFYAQFNNVQDPNVVMTAISLCGYDDIFDVSDAAEVVSALTRGYIRTHKDKWPIISTNCPSVVREIRIRFPRLVDHLLPIMPPQEVAGILARRRFVDKMGVKPEEVGIIYFSPCPAKITNTIVPLGNVKSSIDEVLAIKDVYPQVLSKMKEANANPKAFSRAGRLGLGWAVSGGEAKASMSGNYLYADGMTEIIRVLEALEDEKMNPELEFIELNACSGGCVGGILQVENTYAARAKVKYMQGFVEKTDLDWCMRKFAKTGESIDWTEMVQYENVLSLGDTFIENMENMGKVEALYEKLPKIDCGFCGAPTCRVFAEDVVKGKQKANACLYLADEEEILRRIRRVKEIHNS